MILLVLWLSAATTPAMANDHNGGNGRNACPAGTILHVIYIGGFVRRACVSWASLVSRPLIHVPGMPGNPGPDVQQGDGGIDHDAPLPSPVPAFSGDLNADVDKAIRNCVDSSVVSDVEAQAAAADDRPIVLEYDELEDRKEGAVEGITTCNSLGENEFRYPHWRNITITIDPAKHVDNGKDSWPELAETILHEYYHAKYILDNGCSAATAAKKADKDKFENEARDQARDEYKRIFGKPAPGTDDYDRARDGKAPPPCQ